MDIKQAIERVRTIDDKLNSINRFVGGNHYDGAPVEITSGTWKISVTALFTVQEKLDLIEGERSRLKAERAKLASVIDMANAALRGIGL